MTRLRIKCLECGVIFIDVFEHARHGCQRRNEIVARRVDQHNKGTRNQTGQFRRWDKTPAHPSGHKPSA